MSNRWSRSSSWASSSGGEWVVVKDDDDDEDPIIPSNEAAATTPTTSIGAPQPPADSDVARGESNDEKEKKEEAEALQHQELMSQVRKQEDTEALARITILEEQSRSQEVEFAEAVRFDALRLLHTVSLRLAELPTEHAKEAQKELKCENIERSQLMQQFAIGRMKIVKAEEEEEQRRKQKQQQLEEEEAAAQKCLVANQKRLEQAARVLHYDAEKAWRDLLGEALGAFLAIEIRMAEERQLLEDRINREKEQVSRTEADAALIRSILQSEVDGAQEHHHHFDPSASATAVPLEDLPDDIKRDIQRAESIRKAHQRRHQMEGASALRCGCLGASSGIHRKDCAARTC